MATILIADDEKVLAQSLGMLFRDEGHQVGVALSGRDALRLAAENPPDVMLLDLRLPDMSGLEVLSEVRRTQPEAMVIMMTAHGDTATVVDAVKRGAFHYLNKPFELQEILLLVGKALEQQKLREEVTFLRERRHPAEGLEEMVGNCPAMQEVFRKVRLVAAAGDSAVLITGESGTGKELVAGALHRLSERSAHPFVELNCAAIPENLLESELFGFEKGAFTDAQQRKKGLFELAGQGTLFLDEIGEMPPHLQAKLLRFLEKRSFRRLGGTTDIQVGARIVAATNRDLRELVRQGRFREDLFYRLNVIPVHLPPLRERGSDTLALAGHFLAHFSRRLGRPVKRLAPAAEKAFLAYRWPGNIRELKNIVERLVILCPSEVIPVEQLPAEIRAGEGGPPMAGAFHIDEHLLGVERQLVLAALEEALGKKGLAAERLGISRHAFKRKLQKLGLGGEDEDEP
ncbi:acetoacetate metabolism regulatory protein AtoC [Desulfuromonas versatilis]|uniref:Acetoacetate metabolism regulatory protein AtoC n=1 Tax=Desulfuromonas versatilis TaxID=2802975 RepID=A0ABM8HZZ2_9BACT|nr:sigma-54 dependent transcriptional regulator [Desulfuromonas versatilis]BCR06671.1 acetoacetate metabolism regulatory protein AtoC [Desulfuromonas versatilis]